ncbi:MAG TPA: hypothetical protein VJB94_01535 [Candidatus Nanoarchaeia archaeon]|nr:hypothetical protein [Candidatus Nanoarchaeia archaeon]
MLNFLAVSILAFSGIFFGKILRKIAFEEVNNYKKYLIYLQYLVLFVLAISLVYYLDLSFIVLIFFALGFLSSFLFRKRYFYLGLILASSVFNLDLLVFSSSLVFLYGLSFGALSMGILLNLLYIILGFALVFILPSDFNPYILAFSAGSIFLRY